MVRAELLSCESKFVGGVTTAFATVLYIDDEYGVLGARHVELTNPALLAGVRAAALGLLPASEVALGVPITIPDGPSAG